MDEDINKCVNERKDKENITFGMLPKDLVADVEGNLSRISTGIMIFDKLLEGGFERDTVSMIYGAASSGKTTLCMIASDFISRLGKKIIYIDTEGGFSIDRFRQISPDYLNSLKNINFLKVNNFDEQHKVIEGLYDCVNKSISLVVIDTISMLYRLEIGKSKDVYEVNRKLGREIIICSNIARKNNIPVIITNQVYADIDEVGRNKMVGGDLLRYGCKCLLELIKPDNASAGQRIAVLRKHRSIEEDKKIKFKITSNGIE
ncbi:MAG TPA: DNA repair and recombination protein RadB [Candidatus Woesearchaeota archaeon]|nr:DNA repair and recombination protein RadB [Candidatus Woesearchaeota archaeon]